MDKPVIEIEFSSIVSFLSIDVITLGSLSFLFVRFCNSDEPRVVNSWPYGVFEIEDDNNEIRLSTSFVFNYCECLNFSGCCEYFVEVTLENIVTAVILVDNVHMTALVGDGS